MKFHERSPCRASHNLPLQCVFVTRITFKRIVALWNWRLLRCGDRVGKARDFFIDNLLARIHLIIEMVLVDRPCVMGVWGRTCGEQFISARRRFVRPLEGAHEKRR